jgi:hypothetical protein
MAFTKGRVSGGNTPNSTKDQRENLVNSSKVILDSSICYQLAVIAKTLLNTSENNYSQS